MIMLNAVGDAHHHIIVITSILQCLTMWTEVVLVVKREEKVRIALVSQLKKTLW